MLPNIFPETKFTTTELTILAENFTHPVVKKYLLSEARSSLEAIATGLPKEGESAEEYLRRQAQVVGGMRVYEALLAIETPKKSSS